MDQGSKSLVKDLSFLKVKMSLGSKSLIKDLFFFERDFIVIVPSESS